MVIDVCQAIVAPWERRLAIRGKSVRYRCYSSRHTESLFPINYSLTRSTAVRICNAVHWRPRSMFDGFHVASEEMRVHATLNLCASKCKQKVSKCASHQQTLTAERKGCRKTSQTIGKSETLLSLCCQSLKCQLAVCPLTRCLYPSFVICL